MRGWLVLVVVGACHKTEQEPPKPPPPPPPAPVPAKTLRQAQVEETMLVILPKARADLVARRAHYKSGVPAGEQLAIKAPFHEGDMTEWMWVDVVSWKGDTFEGSLDNDPEQVKNVKMGQTVRVKLADVADFIATSADGSQNGGYSVEVIKKRGLLR